jgi:hypothetical protein
MSDGIGDRRSKVKLTRSFLRGLPSFETSDPADFRKSTVDDYYFGFRSTLILLIFFRCRMDRSSVIPLVKLIHGDKRLSSADAGEDRRSTILVFSSDFRHF